MAPALPIFRTTEKKFYRVNLRYSVEAVHVLNLSGDLLGTLPWSEVSSSPGGEGKHSLVLTGSQGELYIEDKALREKLISLAPPSAQDRLAKVNRQVHSHRKATTLSLFKGWSAAIIGILLFIIYLGDLLAFGVRFLPHSADAWVGDLAYKGFSSDYIEEFNPEIVQPLREIVRSLKEADDNAVADINLHVFQDPMVNAMALPGGNVMVFTGLLRDAQSFDEIAGVLAHELSHVSMRHGMKNVAKSIGFFTGLRVLAVLTGVGDSPIESILPNLLSLQFSRSQEEEADRRGIAIARQAGFSPQGLIGFLNRRSKDPEEASLSTSILLTHPLSSERVAKLSTEAGGFPDSGTNPVRARFGRFKRALGGFSF